MTICLTIFVIAKAKETKGLTLEEVYKLFVFGKPSKVGLLSLSVASGDGINVKNKHGGLYEK